MVNADRNGKRGNYPDDTVSPNPIIHGLFL